jgi:hypothetical protein
VTALALLLMPLRSLQEQFNTIFDCVFVPAAAAAGQEGLLLTAHHSGHIR